MSTNQVITCGSYPFTKGQFAHLLLYRHRNGLSVAVRKIGKRILIQVEALNAWIEKQREDRNV